MLSGVVGGSGLADAGAFLIRGGSGGIGSAVARRLTSAFATVRAAGQRDDTAGQPQIDGERKCTLTTRFELNVIRA